jgi:5-methylcytosine-specific restriction endonuclease McrA
MSDSILQKRPRIRLASVPYASLRKKILARDNWRCQVCGHLMNLDVHHLRRRSALGDDTETNQVISVLGDFRESKRHPARLPESES